MRRWPAALAMVLSTAALAPAAQAADTVFPGVDIGCAPQAAQGGIRFCQGDTDHLVPSFDGAPVDVNVALPPAGEPGPYPLLGMFHGWGGSKLGLKEMAAWAKRGYAVFSMSDRGFGDSCGGTSSTRTSAECQSVGYNHLLDSRYEVHDAQYLISLLADQGLVDGRRVGATGGSYGGGMSMALAALKDRVMTPSGALVPWTSPKGKPMRIAAAAPEIPWTDLSNSLMPNGHTLDYAIAGDGYGPRTGVMKATFVTGLFATGLAASNYAPPQTDPEADLYTWFAATAAGDPYDQNPLTQQVLTELQRHHSSYYIDDSEAPAPLLISNGFTDDLFPVDEAVRFYNRTKAHWPDAYVGMFHLDYGHQRGQGKAADTAILHARQQAFFDHFLLGKGDLPPTDQTVQAMTQTCPKTAASGGPYSAATWAGLAPGEVRFDSDAQQVVADPGDPREGQAFDPIAGPGACATAADPGDVPGTGVYRLPAAAGGGYTLLGAATIIAHIRSASPTDQIVARLLDVAPDGNETLVARGTYRPNLAPETPSQQVFQLHPGAWQFDTGHVAKLELLTADVPYARPSNGQAPMLVSKLELRLPVHDQPGSAPGVVAPAPKYVPQGYALAPDFGGPVAGGGTSHDGAPGPQGAPGPKGEPGSSANNGAPGHDAAPVRSSSKSRKKKAAKRKKATAKKRHKAKAKAKKHAKRKKARPRRRAR